MLKFKIGDKVKITAGKDKDREGEIERVLGDTGRAIIPGINIFKRHIKSMPERKGGIYEVPRPIPFSKIALICPKCKKLVRVGFKKIDNKKTRVCKKCGREIENTKSSK
jgi:large subunit ribosomal protein L24